MDHLETFYAFMTEYADFLDESAKRSYEKYRALLGYDIDAINRTIADQQAMMKKLSQMEERRVSLQQAAGFQDLSFKELTRSLTGEWQDRFVKVFARFETGVADISYWNAKSSEAVAENLRATGTMGDQPPAPPGYGKSEGKGVSLFEKSI